VGLEPSTPILKSVNPYDILCLSEDIALDIVVKGGSHLLRKPGQKNQKTSPETADRVRDAIWLERYSIHTEDTYVAWTKCHRQKQSANALSICPRRS
jgi:hypothetical protein